MSYRELTDEDIIALGDEWKSIYSNKWEKFKSGDSGIGRVVREYRVAKVVEYRRPYVAPEDAFDPDIYGDFS